MLEISNRGKDMDELLEARIGKKVKKGKVFKMTNRVLLLQMLCFMGLINIWPAWIMEDINSLIMNLTHL